MVKRVVVGAHYGLTDWLIQRISAVVLGICTPVLALTLLTHRPLNHESWKALFAHQWMRVLVLLFLLSMFAHAWIGVRDILMDYVHPVAIRLTLEALVVIMLVVYALWALAILWGV
jgi:succinate dehydrogenase membrane anchor subunit